MRNRPGIDDMARKPPPTLAEFRAIAEAAFARLPERFREMCGGVVLRVEDWPDDETLDAMGIESPDELLGLYHGVSLDRKSSQDLPWGPDLVFLYRRPMLRYLSEGDDTLEEVITHVLVHEIGHHFGLSDDDMERIEAAAG